MSRLVADTEAGGSGSRSVRGQLHRAYGKTKGKGNQGRDSADVAGGRARSEMDGLRAGEGRKKTPSIWFEWSRPGRQNRQEDRLMVRRRGQGQKLGRGVVTEQ